MIVYFDTSALIPLIIDEPGSNICERLWNDATRIVSVRLLYAEARAALAKAQRMGRLTWSDLTSAVEVLDGFINEIDFVEISENLVRTAGAMAEELGLRGYDAVHLAAAQAVADNDTILISGDQRLIAVATRLGLSVVRA